MTCLSEQIKNEWDNIAKPIDGMGEFETILTRIGEMQGRTDFSIEKKAVLVFCADNGIVKEGVTQSPSEVTLRVMKNMLCGKSSVAVMAKKTGADLHVVDVGVDCEKDEELAVKNAETLFADETADDMLRKKDFCATFFHNCKIRRGSRDFIEEPAMTEEECNRAMQCGTDLVGTLAKEGIQIIALGEMGIGNTTSSSAVSAAITGVSPEILTGRGAGLSDEGLIKKREVISKALAQYELIGKDAKTILQHVGGYDIAALAGAVIGGMKYHVPIVLDGAITMTAALAASEIEPECLTCCILSHKGKEPAVTVLEDELIKRGINGSSVIHASMALGEGTGAVMMLSLLDLAMEVYHNAARFEDLSMEQYERFN